MRMLRFFIAHAKGDDDATLDRLKRAVYDALVFEAGGRRKVEVTLGRDDYLAHFARLGSWDAWIAYVATGLHPVTREPRYHVFVVSGTRIGKATASILTLALEHGKPVFRWLGGEEDDRVLPGRFKPITLVRRGDGNVRTGWSVD